MQCTFVPTLLVVQLPCVVSPNKQRQVLRHTHTHTEEKKKKKKKEKKKTMKKRKKKEKKRKKKKEKKKKQPRKTIFKHILPSFSAYYTTVTAQDKMCESHKSANDIPLLLL